MSSRSSSATRASLDEVDGAQVMKAMPVSMPCSNVGSRRVCSARRCVRSSSRRTPPVSTQSSISNSRSTPDLGHGLMPIIEPEVDIHSPTKVECEEMLKAASIAISMRSTTAPK